MDREEIKTGEPLKSVEGGIEGAAESVKIWMLMMVIMLREHKLSRVRTNIRHPTDVKLVDSISASPSKNNHVIGSWKSVAPCL